MGAADVHPDWETSPGVLVVTIEGPLWYGNSVAAKDRVLALVAAADPPPRRVVLELLTSSDLDVQGLDTLAELAGALERDGVELRLAGVSARVRRMLERGGLAERVPIDTRLDDAVSAEVREHRRPVVLDADDRPALGARRVECLLGAAGVVELALAVVVVDEQAQRRPALPAREPEHRDVAVRVARGEDRAAADAAPDPHRLDRAVVEDVGLGEVDDRAAVAPSSCQRSAFELPITRSGGMP